MGVPNLGLVDIKLYVIDEYLRLAGEWGGIILVITITTTKPATNITNQLTVILQVIMTWETVEVAPLKRRVND